MKSAQGTGLDSIGLKCDAAQHSTAQHNTVMQSSNLWIGLECGEGENEGKKKRNQQSEAKSKDNQAEAGTKPGAGSRVTQYTDNRLSGTTCRAADTKY